MSQQLRRKESRPQGEGKKETEEDCKSRRLVTSHEGITSDPGFFFNREQITIDINRLYQYKIF